MIPATVIAPQRLQPGEDQVSPSDFGRHFLFEGDSWGSFGSVLGYGLPNFLEFNDRVLVTSCASPGDTLARMADTRNREFGRLLNAWQFDGVLLSAGGNDLIDALPGILQSGLEAQACIRWPAWYRLAAALEIGFGKMVRAVETSRVNKTTRLFVHTYDYPTPRPAGAGIAGPWLCKALEEAQVPVALWSAVANLLFARLRALIRGLQYPCLVVVDTAGSCERAAVGATGESGDWLNEIHLVRRGLRKHAGIWQRAIDTQVSLRLSPP